MYHTVIRMVGDTAVAQDIVQEGFVKVFKQLHRFRGESGIYSWMKRIMVNEAITHIRKNKRQPQIVEADYHLENLSDEPEQENNLAWDVERVHEAIKVLPPRCRMVFNLFLFEGYTHNEIATELTISESTSKTQYMRAKKLLRNHLRAICHEG